MRETRQIIDSRPIRHPILMHVHDASELPTVFEPLIAEDEEVIVMREQDSIELGRADEKWFVLLSP